jgi:hypothetical protein
MIVAKIEETGQIVEVMRIQRHVSFSDKPGWILIDPDLGKPDMTGGIRANIRWISSNTRMWYVRDVTSLALTVASSPAII